MLEKCWPYGFSTIGECNFQTAAYVARYVMKKFNNKSDDVVDMHYSVVDDETGEIHQIEPEFCVMSRRPGIGKEWYEKYKGDIKKDYITKSGAKFPLPKYYDSLIEKTDPEELRKRKAKRRSKIDETDNTYDRLRVKEKVKIAQINQLQRSLENDN